MHRTVWSLPIGHRQLKWTYINHSLCILENNFFFKVFIQLFCKQKSRQNPNEGEKNILGQNGWAKAMWVASCSGRGLYGISQLQSIVCSCPHYLLEISLSIYLVHRNSSQSFLYFWIFPQWNLIFWAAELLLQNVESPKVLQTAQDRQRRLILCSTPKRTLHWAILIWMIKQNSDRSMNRSLCNQALFWASCLRQKDSQKILCFQRWKLTSPPCSSQPRQLSHNTSNSWWALWALWVLLLPLCIFLGHSISYDQVFGVSIEKRRTYKLYWCDLFLHRKEHISISQLYWWMSVVYCSLLPTLNKRKEM